MLTVFAVLCLTVFALLSLATVRADKRLGDASAQAILDYYAADCAAQEILAHIRAGERPAGVTGDTPLYADFTVPISDTQELQVSVLLEDGCVVQRWQAIPNGEWELDEDLNLWDGFLF